MTQLTSVRTRAEDGKHDVFRPKGARNSENELSMVMRDEKISIEAKAIFGYLTTTADKNGLCNVDTFLAAKELGVSHDRFYRHLKDLKESGYVWTEQTRSCNRYGKTMYYIRTIGCKR